jgi:hypothetical protein
MYLTRFNGRYRKTKPEDPDRLMSVFDAIESQVLGQVRETQQESRKGPLDPAAEAAARKLLYFSGEFRLISSQRYAYFLRDKEGWKTAVSNAWPDVGGLNVVFSAEDRRVNFRFDFTRSEVELTVEFASKEQVDEVIAAIDRDLEPLSPLTGFSGSSLSGTKRTYYTVSPIDEAWVKAAVEILRGLSQTEAYFTSGRVFVTSRLNPDFISGSLDKWQEDVLKEWPKVLLFACSRSSGNLNINFECDQLRELVWIEVQADPRSEVDRVLENFQKQLGLDRAPDQPYRYRRFMREYQIPSGHVNIQKLEKAIEEAVDEAFTKPFKKNPVVTDAFLTEVADSRDLRAAQNLPEFLKAVTLAGADIRELKLYLEGPQGSALGIFANLPERRFELRSSIEPKTDTKRFERIAAVFEGLLRLKLKQKETREPDKNAAPGEGRIFKIVVGTLPGAITGLVALAMLALPESQPRYTVEIQRPNPNASLRTNTVFLAWSLTKRQFWSDKPMPDEPADIEFVRQSDNKTEPLSNQKSPLAQKLDPGTWDIIVSYFKNTKSAYVTVTLQ